MIVLLSLFLSAAVVSSLKPTLAASLTASAQQPKSPASKEKKPPSRIDPKTAPKTIPTQPGISQPPRQQPHFNVSFTPQSVRVGETVTFSLQPVNIPAGFSRPLEIDFGDKTPRQQLAAGRMDATHWYSAEGSYSVAIYLTGLRDASFRSTPISEPLTLQVGSWALSPPPSSVEIGEQVLLSIENPSTDRSIQYQFHFGDDSPASGWVTQSQAAYRYHAAGTFKPYVEIRKVIDRPMNALAKTAALSIIVTPLPESALRLDVSPAPSVQAGKVVMFTATLVSKFDKGDSHIRFKFGFGDGTSSDWQLEPAAAHTYSLIGRHSALVEAAWFNERPGSQDTIAKSQINRIDVTAQDAGSNANQRGGTEPGQGNRPANSNRSTGSSSGFLQDLGRYSSVIIPALAVIALAIVFAGYQTLKGRFAVKPEYGAHRDIGIAQMSGGSLAIEFDIHLKPDLTEARYQLDVPEAGLIRYERRQRD